MKNESNIASLVGKMIIGAALIILGIFVFSNAMTTVSADEIVIKQDLIGGQLHVWDTPGVHWQNFGTVTRYKRSSQFWFSSHEDEGKKTDDAIRVQFNDGAYAKISGSMRYSLPSDPNKMISLHRTYHSMAAVDHELVKQVVNKSVFMSGHLMSSRESYAEKRADLINYISEQVSSGVFETEHQEAKAADPISGQEKIVDVVRPKRDAKAPNGITREEESPLQLFGMTVANITINQIDYDPIVETQIKQQQEALMAIQQSLVNSKRAEQDALTIEQQGKASAAKAKWEQEVSKATEITKAEQEKAVAITQAEKNKEVADLSLQTAKVNAQGVLVTAKAESDAKKMALAADNALQARLDAYVEVNKNYASAIGAQRQTPDIAIGGSSSSNAMSLMDLMTIRTARDLNVIAKP